MKVADWEQRLHAFFAESKDRPFAWGTWDCCHFSDTAIRQMSGKSIIPPSIKWHDRRSAYNTIKSLGGNLAQCVKKLALDAGLEITKTAQKGDLVVYYMKDSYAVGIFDGFAIRAPTDDGLGVVSKGYIAEAYRING